jgi:ABC-type multidrug transport system permease subunit
MFNGFRGILYRETKVYRKRFRKQFLASSISPLLFLIAFGWGFGRDVTVEGMSYMTFLVPGLITMASLNQSFSISQEINISRFYFHTFDEYLTAPISHSEIILAETVYGMFKGMISTVLIIVYALLFKVHLTLSAQFFAAILVHTFIFACLAVTTSMFVRYHGDQAVVTNFIITPMIFLCGTFFPVDKLPLFFKWIVYVLPLTYSTKVIRSSLTGSETDIHHFLIMILFGIIFFMTAKMALSKVEG